MSLKNASSKKFQPIEIVTIEAQYITVGEQFTLTKTHLQDNQNTRIEGGYLRSVPRAQIAKVFGKKGGIYLKGRYVEFSNGVQDHTLPQEYFASVTGGQLSIGCKTFDVPTTKVIRKWAKAAVKTSSVTATTKKSSRRAA